MTRKKNKSPAADTADDEKTRAAFAELRKGGRARERRPSYNALPVEHRPWKKGELPKHADGSPASRPIAKGEVRNPTGENGRSPTAREVRNMAREKTPRMMQILEEIAEDVDAKPQARAAAANMLIDRGYGKAVQPVAESSMSVFEDMDEEQLDGYILDGARDFVASKREDGVYEIEPGGAGETRKKKGKQL